MNINIGDKYYMYNIISDQAIVKVASIIHVHEQNSFINFFCKSNTTKVFIRVKFVNNDNEKIEMDFEHNIIKSWKKVH